MTYKLYEFALFIIIIDGVPNQMVFLQDMHYKFFIYYFLALTCKEGKIMKSGTC